MTARPFELSAPAYGGSSSYCMTPPMKTVSGRPAGLITNWSYQHWPRQKFQVAYLPGSDFVGADSCCQTGVPVRALSERRSFDASIMFPLLSKSWFEPTVR